MKKRLPFLIAGLVILAGLTGFLLLRNTQAQETNLLVAVKKSDFEITVTASGELEAKNSLSITGPSSLRNVQIWQVKIADLVAEGTVVKKGDYVASLDKTEASNKMRDADIELQKAQSQFTQAQLDTALTLRAARDELSNQTYAVEEKNIVLQQSKFEPPAVIRQSEIDLEKAKRNVSQTKENYRIKRNQAIAKMSEVSANLQQVQRKVEMIVGVLDEFTIKAPEGGMVIYARDWGGKKIKVGDQINTWEPTVATLPDMSVMVSKTFVNEVDIRKIQKDQFVKIGFDAFPEKKLTGKVVNVANVGEQRPNSDAKVFSVEIQVNESDTILRPAMTTSNNIIAGTIKNVLHIPLECIHSQGDSLTFVFKKDGVDIVKQEVKTGQTNENEVIITEGLAEKEEVYLSVPKEADKKQIRSLPKNKKMTAAEKSPGL